MRVPGLNERLDVFERSVDTLKFVDSVRASEATDL